MRRGSVAAFVVTTALGLGLAGIGFAERGDMWHPRGAPPPAPSRSISSPAPSEGIPPLPSSGDPPLPAWHRGLHSPPAVREPVIVGPSIWWGEPWWGEPNYFDYPYEAPPVLVQEAPPVFLVQEAPAPQVSYWYYCPNPPGYYPYVRTCPAGWMKVVPSPAASPPGAPAARPSVSTYEGSLTTLILAHPPELGLTPEQLEKLQALRASFEQAAAPRGAAIQAAETDLQTELAKEHWDLPAIDALVRQLATLQGGLRMERLKTLAAAQALLTPEQLQKLQAIAGGTAPAGAPGVPAPSAPGAPPPPPQ